MCPSIVKKTDKRINDVVTHDETFKLILINDLKNLDREFKDVTLKNDIGIDIIGYFFRLVGHLLGWAHLEGEFYRTPIYHQTKELQDGDLRKSSKLKFQTGINECFKKRHIIKDLLSAGNSYPAVALIMGMTIANVKSLEKNEFIDDLYKSSYEKKIIRLMLSYSEIVLCEKIYLQLKKFITFPRIYNVSKSFLGKIE